MLNRPSLTLASLLRRGFIVVRRSVAAASYRLEKIVRSVGEHATNYTQYNVRGEWDEHPTSSIPFSLPTLAVSGTQCGTRCNTTTRHGDFSPRAPGKTLLGNQVKEGESHGGQTNARRFGRIGFNVALKLQHWHEGMP